MQGIAVQEGQNLAQGKVVSLWACNSPGSPQSWNSNQSTVCRFLSGVFKHSQMQLLFRSFRSYPLPWWEHTHLDAVSELSSSLYLSVRGQSLGTGGAWTYLLITNSPHSSFENLFHKCLAFGLMGHSLYYIFIFIYSFIAHAGICMWACMCHTHIEIRRQFWGASLLLEHMGPGDQTDHQAGGQCLPPLSHLTDPRHCN